MVFNNDFVYRSVEFTKDANDDIKALEQQIPRFRQILQGIYEFLKVSAHNGKQVQCVHFYVTNKLPDAPPIEVYYKFDDRMVTVYNLWVSEDI